MASFPNLADGKPVAHPLTRVISCKTRVYRFLNDTEQRWVQRIPVNRFDMPYEALSAADRSTLDTFFVARKGRFDQTWDLTILGTLYANLAFDHDDFLVREPGPLQYSVALSAKQFPSGAGATITVSDPAFPTLSSGAIAQHPSSIAKVFSNAIEDTPDGQRISWNRVATSLPTWVLGFPIITDTERNTLMDFFIQLRGRWGQMSLLWDGTNYQKCRFADDDMRIRYNAPNQNSIECRIEQYV